MRMLSFLMVFVGLMLTAGSHVQLEFQGHYGRPLSGDIAAANGRLYVVSPLGLEVFTFSNPEQPERVGLAEIHGHEARYSEIITGGDHAFVLVGRHPYTQWHIYDISDPEPVLKGTLPAQRFGNPVGQLEGNLFLEWVDAPGDDVFRIFDVTDPARPVETWTTRINERMHLANGILMIAFSSRIDFYSLADPASPTLLSTLEQSNRGLIQVVDDLVYIGQNEVQVIDIHDPANPVFLGTSTLSGRKVTIDGNRALVLTGENELQQYDMSDPLQPVLQQDSITAEPFDAMTVDGEALFLLTDGHIKRYRTTDLQAAGTLNAHGSVYDQAVAGNRMFLISDDAMEQVDISQPQNPLTVKTTPIRTSSFKHNRIVVGSDRLIYQDTNSRFQVSDLHTGEPIPSGSYFSSYSEILGMAIYGAQFYVSGSTHLQVFDLADLQSGEIYVIPILPNFTGHTYDRKVDLYVDEPGKRLLLINYGIGLQVYSLTDPRQPKLIGNISAPGTERAGFVRGDYLWVAADTGGIHVFDLRATEKPVAWIATAGRALDIVAAGDLAFVADGLEGLSVFDVSDPMIPRFECRLPLPGETRRVSIVDDLLLIGGDTGVSLYRFSRDRHTSVVPWMVGNQDFTGHLALFNSGTSEETVQLQAVSPDGTSRDTVLHLPAGSVRSLSATELFSGLSAYSLFVSASSRIYPSYQIRHATKGVPARTIGAPLDSLTSGLLFGQVDERSALVLVAIDQAGETPVTLRISNEQGSVLAEKTLVLSGRRPHAAMFADLFPGVASAVVHAVTGGDAHIAGTSFTFNALGEPAMSRAISYTP